MESITFYGAASEVGRSCFVVESHETTMLDCGIKLDGRTPVPPTFDLKKSGEIDQVLISHAHLDHVGYVPALYQNGFNGKTLMTKPSRDIAQVLLADALRLQRETLFTKKSVDKLFNNIKLVEYRKPSGGVEYRDAGHVLGSGMILLDTGEHRILYTGDVNLRPTRLLDGADLEDLEADILITEGTYGGSHVRQASKKTINTFIHHVGTTLRRGGKVLIPTFAIGRGQEMLLTLESHMRGKIIPQAPIFLDGMVKKLTKIHRHNANYLKKEVQQRILTSDDDPFKSEYFEEPTSKTKHEVFNAGRAVIVAPSGMLVGGPSVRYFKKLAPDKKNTVIIVGYQANDTPGRLVKEGVKNVEVDGENVEINCQVEVAPFSGHSDSLELMQLARRVKGLKQVFVVHSERDKGLELAKQMSTKLHVKSYVPIVGEKVQI